LRKSTDENFRSYWLRKAMCRMNFYRIYHIDSRGGTAALRNFTATDDVVACQLAGAIMAQSKWPGIELWEKTRQVLSAGEKRSAAGMADFPPQKRAAIQ
jgi:hypothetical protein